MTETGKNQYENSNANGVHHKTDTLNNDDENDEEFGRFELPVDSSGNYVNKTPRTLTNKILTTGTMNSKMKSTNNTLDHENLITENRSDDHGNHNLGGKETKAVSFLRLVVLAVLVVSATCTAIAVYFYTRNSELRSFESEFYADAENIIHGVGNALYVTLGAIDSYVLHVISQAHDTNQEFPFVTIPDTHVHMAKLGSIGRTIMMQQAHFVSSQQRIEWENYTAHNNQWINNSLQQHNTDLHDTTNSVQNISTSNTETKIHSYDGPSINDGPYLPTWQCHPIIPGNVSMAIPTISKSTVRNNKLTFFPPFVFDSDLFANKGGAYITLMH